MLVTVVSPAKRVQATFFPPYIFNSICLINWPTPIGAVLTVLSQQIHLNWICAIQILKNVETKSEAAAAKLNYDMKFSFYDFICRPRIHKHLCK